MGDLYTNIETLCKSRNITITTMCKESGASRGSLTDLRHGRNSTLHSETLKKIAAYFGVSVDYLLGNEKSSSPEEDELIEELQILRDNPETRALLRSSKSLTKEQVEIVTSIIKQMRGNQG